MVQVTQLLERARDGDASAKERLLEITYEELRRLAEGYMRHERAGHTMQATALVHSACIHLLQGEGVDRTMASGVQHDQAAQFAGLQAASP